MQVHDTIFFIVLMVNVALIEALEVDGARYYSARELATSQISQLGQRTGPVAFAWASLAEEVCLKCYLCVKY